MICKNCGNDLPEGARFCDKCGAVMEQAQSQAPGIQMLGAGGQAGGYGGPQLQGAGSFHGPMEQQRGGTFNGLMGRQQTANYMEPSKYSKVFVDPDEQLQGTLGNGYLENLLFGQVKKCHALLTDRRVYFQGRFLYENGKHSEWLISEEIVDLEDITGTGFIYSKPIGILKTLIYLIIPWIVALLWFVTDEHMFGIYHDADAAGIVGLIGDAVVILITIVRYILNRKTYFSMEYAGGAIKFDAKIIGVPAVRDFQKQIRRAKDRATGKG